jgi:hypothetical protein
MNQKIATWLGTVILIIISITVVRFVWLFEKEGSQQMQNSQVINRNRVLKTIENQDINQEEDIEAPSAGDDSQKVESDILSICGQNYFIDKTQVDSVEVGKRIVQLQVALDEDNCRTFLDGFKSAIGVKMSMNGNVTRIVLYDKNSGTEKDDQFDVENVIDYTVYHYQLKDGKIYGESLFDGSEFLLGNLK